LNAKKKALADEYKKKYGVNYTGLLGRYRLNKAVDAHIANLTLGKAPSNNLETEYAKALADYNGVRSQMDSGKDIRAINDQYGKDMRKIKEIRASEFEKYEKERKARK
jgi:hypothetical protein